MELKITHDKKNHKFTVKVEGRECHLDYRSGGKKVIDFNFTYVPGELRGKGIAALLVEEGLKYAAENKFKVIPSCSYVNLYIHRNNKYKNLLESEQDE